MANKQLLNILKSGYKNWNEHRLNSYPEMLNLEGADFRELQWSNHFDLRRVNLKNACFDYCNLIHTDFEKSDLSGASFVEAILWGANFTETKLIGSIFFAADLSNAYFNKADLTMAKLNEAKMIKTQFENSILSDCVIYGVSTWGVEVINCYQANLRITLDIEPSVTVDNLEVAQFIHLLLNSSKIRNVIDTLTSKVVLILGRFTAERLDVLHSISEQLRTRNYLPVIFNFEKPITRDITETVSILAGISRFVIADITDARSIPQELMRIVPSFPSLPIIPIINSSDTEYAMFEHFQKFEWVRELFVYSKKDDLNKYITELIIK